MIGRRPYAIAAAAISLALEANDNKVDSKKIADTLNVAETTVKVRYRELRKILVQLAAELPWGKDLKEKDVPKRI